MTDVTPDPKDRHDRLFRTALLIRLVEERIIDLYPSDCIQSPVHLSIGQEAVAVGVCEPLQRNDLLFGTYRGHAYYLARGGDLNAMFAELFGKIGGVSKGKAGSMHLAAPAVGMMGSSAVVASAIPHAVGAALAARVRNTNQVIVTAFGDGATEEGVYHESLNFAALHGLPVLFVCENNGLAVHASLAERQAYRMIDQARLYGIPAETLTDGWDFLAIADATDALVREIRRDGRPRYLEVATYRSREHVGPAEDFGAGYRRRIGLEDWQDRDPLIQDTDRIARLTPEITAEIDRAEAFARASPWPEHEDLLSDVV